MNEKNTAVVIQKKHLVIAAILILLLLVSCVLLTFNLVHRSETGTGFQPAAAEIDANAGQWNGTPLPDKSEQPQQVGIKIPGYPSITLPANKETVRMTLLNPEGNPCYFTFELVLRDVENNTEESLYQSKLVPPGQAITEITMTRALTAGSYDAVIKITTTSLEDGSPMNGANVETVLIAQ